MTPQTALVIGAGIGGIATAARLARQGYQVKVLEKNESPGGRCGQLEIQGHRIDTGPTLYLMPELYQETFQDLGTRIEDHLRLQRVDPTYHIHFDDQTLLKLTCDRDRMREQLETIEPGAYHQLERYLEEGRRHYVMSLEHVVRKDFQKASEFFTLKNLAVLLRLKALTRHYTNIGNFFRDERLKFAFIFQNLYMGIHPYRAPAIFSLLQFTELSHGVWFPEGGMYAIIKALVDIAAKQGVEFKFNSPVAQIITDGREAKGVLLQDGSQHYADVLIANADLGYVYQNLLPGEAQTSKHAEKKHGCSALVFYWGLDRRFPQLATHNLFMSKDIRAGFDRIFDELDLTDDPSFYVHVPTRIDPSLAPESCDTISVAVPVPHLDETKPQDWERLTTNSRRYIIERLEAIGVADVEKHLKFEVCYTPHDWKKRFNLTKGSAHGLSHELLQMGYFRPAHQHKHFRNLYFVGASTHPGTGLPSVLVSAKQVADAVLGKAREEHRHPSLRRMSYAEGDI